MGSSHPQQSGAKGEGPGEQQEGWSYISCSPTSPQGEQHLLLRDLPLLMRFWKPQRAESPRSQSHPVSQLWRGEAGITWERGKGPRDRFGEGGMCYCEEGICLP